jgi:hypothetical protein
MGGADHMVTVQIGRACEGKSVTSHPAIALNVQRFARRHVVNLES